MRARLVLISYAGRTVRGTPRFAATAVLAVPYALGLLAGLVLVSALSIAAAARLGWSDVRKGRHGSA